MMNAQTYGISFQIAQVAMLPAEVRAIKREYRRPYLSAFFEHSQVYRALNLILYKLFQILSRIGSHYG
jgi:hypothetical protein